MAIFEEASERENRQKEGHSGITYMYMENIWISGEKVHKFASVLKCVQCYTYRMKIYYKVYIMRTYLPTCFDIVWIEPEGDNITNTSY